MRERDNDGRVMTHTTDRGFPDYFRICVQPVL